MSALVPAIDRLHLGRCNPAAGKVPEGTRSVLRLIACFAGDAIAWPTNRTIGDQTGLTGFHVCRALDWLHESGLVVFSRRPVHGNRGRGGPHWSQAGVTRRVIIVNRRRILRQLQEGAND